MENFDPIQVEDEFQWLLSPIRTAFEEIRPLGFFSWVDELKSPQQFAPVAKQIYFHSSTFPKAIGLMLSMIPVERGEVYKVVSEHAYEEADHHLLLLDWMLQQGILQNKSEINKIQPFIETSNCINIGYQYAIERDINAWMAGINGAIEYCFYHFFEKVSKKMHQLGAGHHYFDVHVGADQYHSVMGLKHIEMGGLSAAGRDQLVRKSLNCVSLWTTMVHSWLGISVIPVFTLEGKRR